MAYQHLDFPLANADLLHHQLTQSLQELWLRMEGRGEIAQSLQLLLFHEYSDQKTNITIRPKQPTRDLPLILKLWHEKLHQQELLNPVQEYEIEILTQPYQMKQLSLDEPRLKEKDELQRLQLLLAEKEIHLDFLKIQNHFLPEKSSTYHHQPQTSMNLDWSSFQHEGKGHRELPCYGQSLNTAPRPHRLLQNPEKISPLCLQQLKFLHPFPLERLESAWEDVSRDYWITLQPTTDKYLWVFHDHKTSEYRIHGYFD